MGYIAFFSKINQSATVTKYSVIQSCSNFSKLGVILLRSDHGAEVDFLGVSPDSPRTVRTEPKFPVITLRVQYGQQIQFNSRNFSAGLP